MVNKKIVYVAVKDNDDIEEFKSEREEFSVSVTTDNYGNPLLLIKQGYETIAMFAQWIFWRYGGDNE